MRLSTKLSDQPDRKSPPQPDGDKRTAACPERARRVQSGFAFSRVRPLPGPCEEGREPGAEFLSRVKSSLPWCRFAGAKLPPCRWARVQVRGHRVRHRNQKIGPAPTCRSSAPRAVARYGVRSGDLGRPRSWCNWMRSWERSGLHGEFHEVGGAQPIDDADHSVGAEPTVARLRAKPLLEVEP